MNYYQDDTQQSRRWAWGALLIYGVLVLLMLFLVKIDLGASVPKEAIVVEFLTEPELKPEPVLPPPAPAPVAHAEVDAQEQTAEAKGEAEETRTVNQRALFRQSAGGVDEPENAGNPQAAEAEEESASGSGSGLAPEGSDQLDRGLQGRGLVGALPKPRYTGRAEGKVVIRVTVDRTGRVTAATYEPKGSTISNDDLIREATQAALKARFTESQSYIQGGTITYIFTLKR